MGLDFTEESTLSLTLSDDGVVQMPEGYKYCNECRLICPHEKYKYGHRCMICGDQPHASGVCENCNWEEPDANQNYPLSQYYIIHQPGCHFNEDEYDGDEMFDNWADKIADQFAQKNIITKKYHSHSMITFTYDQLLKLFIEHRNIKCNCPRVFVYNITHVCNFSSWYGHGMDCSTHIEWEYDLKCPICGNIFYMQDGNC